MNSFSRNKNFLIIISLPINYSAALASWFVCLLQLRLAAVLVVMDPPYQRPELLPVADIERKYPHRYVSRQDPFSIICSASLTIQVVMNRYQKIILDYCRYMNYRIRSFCFGTISFREREKLGGPYFYFHSEFLSLFDVTCIFYVCLSIGTCFFQLDQAASSFFNFCFNFFLASTIICIHQNWLSDEPLTLLANIVVIPVSFTINFAIDRRENLLLNIAGFKVCIAIA